MHKRPRIFIILALLHFLEPLSKLLYFKITTRFPFQMIIENVLANESLLNQFEFWVLFPLAGIALLTIKPWSHPLFIGTQLYSLWSVLTYRPYSWPYIAPAPHLTSVLILTANVLLITYILLPGVRRPFYDRRVRWWETKKRYKTEIPCSLHLTSTTNNEIRTHILNISHSGAFLSLIPEAAIGQNIRLDFKYHELEFSLNAVIKNRHKLNDIEGNGVQFVYTNWKESWAMRLLLKRLQHS